MAREKKDRSLPPVIIENYWQHGIQNSSVGLTSAISGNILGTCLSRRVYSTTLAFSCFQLLSILSVLLFPFHSFLSSGAFGGDVHKGIPTSKLRSKYWIRSKPGYKLKLDAHNCSFQDVRLDSEQIKPVWALNFKHMWALVFNFCWQKLHSFALLLFHFSAFFSSALQSYAFYRRTILRNPAPKLI